METKNSEITAARAEKARLWKRFAGSGRIEDYLAYSRFDGGQGKTVKN